MPTNTRTKKTVVNRQRGSVPPVKARKQKAAMVEKAKVNSGGTTVQVTDFSKLSSQELIGVCNLVVEFTGVGKKGVYTKKLDAPKAHASLVENIGGMLNDNALILLSGDDGYVVQKNISTESLLGTVAKPFKELDLAELAGINDLLVDKTGTGKKIGKKLRPWNDTDKRHELARHLIDTLDQHKLFAARDADTGELVLVAQSQTKLAPVERPTPKYTKASQKKRTSKKGKASSTPAERAAKARAAKAAKNGFDQDQRVHMLTKKNPYNGKSDKKVKAFSLLKENMTVADYVKAGGTVSDIKRMAEFKKIELRAAK